MEPNLYIYSKPNYLSRTAIEAEILFAVCLSKKQALTGGKSLACEDKYSKKIGAVLVQQADRRSFEASAVTILVCFYILCNNKSYKEPSGFLRAEPLSSYFEDRKGYREGKKLLSDKSVFPSLTYHLQSAQFITNAKGERYEHIEYTPYGELWTYKSKTAMLFLTTYNNFLAKQPAGLIEETAPGIDKLPFRFTGKELDEETGLYYYGARYLDPKYSRWLSGDPALGEYIPQAPVNDEAKKHNENLPGLGGVYNTVNLHVYHYAGNNPVKYTDPDGRTDYIYHLDDEGNVTKTKENDWGFWEFLHIDRYYVETSDGTRYRANSEETVELYQFNKIDVDFLNQKFNEMVDKANEKPTNLSRIWNESINGDLDFKNDMDKTTLYFNGKVLYNNHEAGNFVWAYFLTSKGYGWLHGILAQGGSLFGFLLGQEYKSSRFDEWHDVKARYAGQYYYFKNNKIRR